MSKRIAAPFQKGDRVEVKDDGGMRKKETRAEVVAVGYDISPVGPTSWRVKIHFDGAKKAQKFWWSTAWFKLAKP